MQPLPPLPSRPQDAHKGEFGRILVVAGSPGMTGAACLAASAALRSGAGLVWAAAPRSCRTVLAVKLTAVMTLGLEETPAGTVGLGALPSLLRHPFDALLVGPGLGRNRETDLFVRDLAREVPAPLVVDADGLTALSGSVSMLKDRSAPTVLTPHPGEMARLLGRSVADVQADRKKAAVDLARNSGAVVALKGAGTVLSDGTQTVVNTTGNPGMATAGAGDVLGGILAAFLGRGMPPMDSAVLAVHLHGAAGDLAAARLGGTSLTAPDILHALPEAFQKHS